MYLCKDIAQHLETNCPKVRVECPKGCGEKPKRSQVHHHLLTCLEVMVVCGVNGCKQQCKRGILEKHKEEQATVHELMGIVENQKTLLLQLTNSIGEMAQWKSAVNRVDFEFTFLFMSSKLRDHKTTYYLSRVFTIAVPGTFALLSVKVGIETYPGESGLGIFVVPDTSTHHSVKFPLCIGGSFFTLVGQNPGLEVRKKEFPLDTYLQRRGQWCGWHGRNSRFVSNVCPFIRADQSLLVKGVIQVLNKAPAVTQTMF